MILLFGNLKVIGRGVNKEEVPSGTAVDISGNLSFRVYQGHVVEDSFKADAVSDLFVDVGLQTRNRYGTIFPAAKGKKSDIYYGLGKRNRN